jgi:hypothetical protein
MSENLIGTPTMAEMLWENNQVLLGWLCRKFLMIEQKNN